MDVDNTYETYGDALLQKKDVAQFLGISEWKLTSLQRNPACNFPKPINLDGMKKYSLSDLKNWVNDRREWSHSNTSASEVSKQARNLIKDNS
jgi:predicted DNA-binding transcriptional regulator AlpA